MITVHYKSLRSEEFDSALRKLYAYSAFPTSLSYNVGKLKKKLDSEIGKAQSSFIELLKKYADLDDKGNFIPSNGEPGTFHVPEEKKDAWMKARDTFEEMSVNILHPKMRLHELDGVKLTPVEIVAIENLVEVKAAEEV